MSTNPFDILCDDSLVEDLEKQKKTPISSSSNKKQQQAILLFESSKRKHKQHTKKNKQAAPFELIYDVEYLWFVVLEFLPLGDLLKCSQLDKFTHSLVHSYNCYAEILKRDFLKHKNSSDYCKTIKNKDNVGIYIYLLREFFVNTKIAPLKQQQLKQMMTQVPDERTTKIFRSIYLTIEETIKDQNSEIDALRQHARRFLIEKVGLLRLDGMKTKVRECSHNHCEMSADIHLTYTMKIECLDCKLVAWTNFNPCTIFKKEKFRQRYYHSFQASSQEKYVLGNNHAYEFDKSTLRY